LTSTLVKNITNYLIVTKFIISEWPPFHECELGMLEAFKEFMKDSPAYGELAKIIGYDLALQFFTYCDLGAWGFLGEPGSTRDNPSFESALEAVDEAVEAAGLDLTGTSFGELMHSLRALT
jgi:hypothetical protein